MKRSKNLTKRFNYLLEVLGKNKRILILYGLFAVHVFLRFYKLEEWLGFGWDQVDNAWAVKRILIDHEFPLRGMAAKFNSGFFIGPAYYYLIAPVYWLTDLDPVASGIIAGLTSIIAFIILYAVTKRIAGYEVTMFVLLFTTVSVHIIRYDRTQWPVNFIASVSYIIFYLLYRVICGEPRYLIWLAIAVGFSFHIHVTAIFYPILIVCTLPLFPRTRETLQYMFMSLPLFLIWLVPHYLSESATKGAQVKSISSYTDTYYHGFHMTRVFQLVSDAFIEFGHIMRIRLFEILKYVLIPIFALLLYSDKKNNRRWKLLYLVVLWFLVPWIVLSLYKGEISNYYFFSTQPVALLVLGYITYRIFIASKIGKVAIIMFLCYFSYIQVDEFFKTNQTSFLPIKYSTKHTVDLHQEIEWKEGDPKSYIYYVEKRKQERK